MLRTGCGRGDAVTRVYWRNLVSSKRGRDVVHASHGPWKTLCRRYMRHPNMYPTNAPVSCTTCRKMLGEMEAAA